MIACYRPDTKPMPYVSILKIALGPLLLVQGRRARRTALRMPEAAGQRQGWIPHRGSDNTLNLLFVGDSTMAGVGVAHQEAERSKFHLYYLAQCVGRSLRRP